MGKRTRQDSPALLPAKEASRELFEFIRAVLAAEGNLTDPELVRDEEVCALIYPDYPYGSAWKAGRKDVGRAVEMDLLARNAGIPLEWILQILEGRWTAARALREYHKHSDTSKTNFAVHADGDTGAVDLWVQLDSKNPYVAAVASALLQEWLDTELQSPLFKSRKRFQSMTAALEEAN